jgi:hypothetical protein
MKTKKKEGECVQTKQTNCCVEFSTKFHWNFELMLFQSDKKNFTKAKGGAETKIPEEAILEA